MGVSAGTGLAPSSAGMSTLSSKASRSTPLEVYLETRGAEVGGKMFFMVDFGSSFSFKVVVFFLFRFVAGESERRGKLIAVNFKLLTAFGRLAQ